MSKRATSFQADHTRDRPLRDVDEAQRLILSSIGLIGTEKIRFSEASGRILREDVTSPHDVPFVDNSAMDGYAVRSEDLRDASPDAPVTLRVIDDAPAGSVSKKALESGSAIRIMTGAPVPAGADAVIPVEETDGGGVRVRVFEPVHAGQNLRSRGEDVKEGEIVLRAGTVIGPAEVGVLASVQKTKVRVARRPAVAILPTGSEIIEVDGKLGEGKVVNSNAYALEAMVRYAGGDPRRAPIVPDTLEETVEAIEAVLDADFVLSTGGVSVGAWDWVDAALQRLEAERLIHGVSMKPGKPLLFAIVRDKPFFGLPGNPVSCLVTFLLFVAPALRRVLGYPESRWLPPIVTARAAGEMISPKGRREYQRVRLVDEEGTLVAHPMPAQGSGILTSMIGASGLAVIEQGVSRIETGESVPVVVIGEIT